MSDKIVPDAEGNEVPQAEAPTDGSPEAARREVLKRLGVYGALISPALLAALSSSASAQVVVDSGATN
jgi:hypothetical protein